MARSRLSRHDTPCAEIARHCYLMERRVSPRIMGTPACSLHRIPVIAALEAALVLRRSGAEAKVLRRALRRIEELLDE